MSWAQKARRLVGIIIIAFAILIYFSLQIFPEEIGAALRNFDILPEYNPVMTPQMAWWGLVLYWSGLFILAPLLIMAYSIMQALFGDKWKLAIGGAFSLGGILLVVFGFLQICYCNESLKIYYPNGAFDIYDTFLYVGFMLYVSVGISPLIKLTNRFAVWILGKADRPQTNKPAI